MGFGQLQGKGPLRQRHETIEREAVVEQRVGVIADNMIPLIKVVLHRLVVARPAGGGLSHVGVVVQLANRSTRVAQSKQQGQIDMHDHIERERERVVQLGARPNAMGERPGYVYIYIHIYVCICCCDLINYEIMGVDALHQLFAVGVGGLASRQLFSF